MPRPPGGAAATTQFRPEELCTIEGIARNALNGEGLGKVMLMAVRATGAGERRPVGATSTNEGKFSINGLEPGEYRLSASRNGYVSAQYGSRRPMSPGTALRLEKGQTIKDVEIKLTPHAVVTGRVVDADGEPVVHAAMQLMRPGFQQGRRQLMPVGAAMTNDLGEYRIFGVAPGKYLLAAQPSRFGAMQFMQVSASSSVNNAGGGEEVPARTYYPGTAEAGQAGSISVALGGLVQGIDVRLQNARGFRVRGQISGLPSESGRGSVRLLPRDSSVAGWMFDSPNTQWERGGKFELRGVQPGSYFVMAMYFEDSRMAGRAPVDVGEANVDNVQVELQAGFALRGTVRMEGPAVQQQQQQVRLSEVRVMLHEDEGFGMFGISSGAAKDDGTLVINNVVPGKYGVSVMNVPDGYYAKSIRLGEEEALRNAAPVSSATPLTIVLAQGAATLSGTVTDEQGRANTTATVLLVPPGPHSIHRQRFVKFVVPTQDGSYTIRGITPGEYVVVAVDDYEMGAEQDPEFMKTHSKNLVKVTLREGASESRALKASVGGL